MAIGRVIRPEILDDLPADDPAARRSRRDLLLINALQGNPAWLRRHVRGPRLVELGAGDGALCRRLARWFPEAQITALDLVPRPPGLPDRVTWRQGDLFQALPALDCDTVVGSMILHHFSPEALATLGGSLKARRLCLCEPWRSGLSHFWARLFRPFVGGVTRHDMPVSIDAGFVRGELPVLLGLAGWKVKESVHWKGVLRLHAWKE